MFLEDNLFNLHQDLKQKIYRHSNYTEFYITDPKLRHIHKAKVRDRIVHHAIYSILYPIFDKSFIYDSYSCRNQKGTHKAVFRLENFCRKISSNYNITGYYLKCDIKKYFDSIDHKILLKLIKNKVRNKNTLWLIKEIISSFNKDDCSGRGLPLGNLTSQLFANIYLNELDQFIKHTLKIKYYIRYCDDFVILDDNQKYLADLVRVIDKFLQTRLELSLNKNKIFIRKISQGIDFLGYVILPHYRVLRTKTKKRMFKKLAVRHKEFYLGRNPRESFEQSRQSYLGMLSHCHSYKLQEVLNLKFFRF